jgi:hypothetical protein
MSDFWTKRLSKVAFVKPAQHHGQHLEKPDAEPFDAG